MKIVISLAAVIATLIAIGCGRNGTADTGKPIKSAQAGDLTVTLSSPAGDLKNGENELMVTFADASGKTVDVGAASLSFHMPAMGSMAEMNDQASLTTTNTPGKYKAKVDLEVGGTWEAQIKYQGPNGSGQARMTVNAK